MHVHVHVSIKIIDWTGCRDKYAQGQKLVAVIKRQVLNNAQNYCHWELELHVHVSVAAVERWL